MKMRRLQWLLCVSALCGAAVLGFRTYDRARWRERPDATTGVALELSPARQVIKVGEFPLLEVSLVNHGSQGVVLVEPGDGSDCGWRTPVVEWSGKPWQQSGRCGNINPLQAEEVFSLRPGESRQLSGWVGEPYLSGPGRYRVSVRYTNRPDHKWRGIPLDDHDATAMSEVRRSTPVTAVSNTIEIVVEE
jgi:hypothetical protein